MGQPLVKAHTRQGYEARSHTRRGQGSGLLGVLGRDRVRFEERLQAQRECPHQGQFLARLAPGDAHTTFRCQDCRCLFSQSQMLAMNVAGKVFRPEQIERVK